MLSPVKIGHHIRQLREAHNYSQDYMAEMLNISQSSYAVIEAGKVHMRVDRLYEIAAIFDVHPIRLLTDQTPSEKAGMNGNGQSTNGYDELILELRSEIAFLRHIVELQEKRK